ncbi:cache domain-containing protein [Pseudoruegeria sp. HB172150]|uniref:cache domain-containing protein n=1 Tax=Pseudoruegeria sp. HB172150 TaxID=2721164 RepID=UPI00155467F4|nr:cache domain-containing protein [Pseudoruegeria sp. HB172150]
MSRRLTLVIGLVALQALALVVVLGISYFTSQDELLDYAEGLAARIASDTTAYTEDFLDPANDAADLSYRLAETGVLDPTDREKLTRYFFETLRVQEQFAGIYYGVDNGDFLYVSRDGAEDGADFRVKEIITRPRRIVDLAWYNEGFRLISDRKEPEDDYDPRIRPWYNNALEAGGASWTSPYIFFTSKKPGITVSVPVDDPLTGETQGAIGVDIGIEALSRFLEDLQISPNGSAAIVAETGDIIAHSDPALVATTEANGTVRFSTLSDGGDPILTQAVAEMDAGLEGLFPGEVRVSRFRADGEVWLGAVQRLQLERTPWTVVTYLPQSDILEPLWRLRNTAIWVAVLALLATAALGLLYGGAVMRSRQ